MTWRPSFQVDRDAVRSKLAVVTDASLSGGVATLTTSLAHEFATGWQVSVSDVGEPFDGTFSIIAVTETTFSFVVVGEDQSVTGLDGVATAPAPAFVRYPVGDTILDNITSSVSFYAESWDYNTVRLIWSVDADLEAKAQDDLADGLTPRMAITRSAFGYPVTPLDGDKILDLPYTEVVWNEERRTVRSYFETQPAQDPNSRPALPSQALYDRNLPSGRWFYYSIFFYIAGDDDDPSWRLAGSIDALTPVDFKHAERLFNLLPTYYQAKDSEFLQGTGREGTLQRLLTVIGRELDYTKTLADGLEHIYDIDSVQDDLMHLLGQANLGVALENGLGDIRYRSMLATISNLYEERGNTSALQKLTLASTKYRCKVLEGINIMNLTDDSEFLTGTGSWGTLVDDYGGFLDGEGWIGADPGDTTFAPATLVALTAEATNTDLATSLVPRRTMVEISGDPDSLTDAVIIACGLGRGSTLGRRHEPVEAQFYPRFHGIRCVPGTIYTFSFYSLLSDGDDGTVVAGIMWFNDVKKPSWPPEAGNDAFNITLDFIKKTENPSLDPESTTSFARYSVESQAPIPLRGEGHLYAVPYIAFSNGSTRRVSACMFNAQVNPAATFAVETNLYLTLGDEGELLGSEYVLGDG